ncbi:hydroxyethylthiazole kinase [Acinetobacter marinus]|uniref:Hydroxyethylthiazole kinase n=1 Tax=Acinetobacter marinus TaxID=281375 RepID=A0A1G6H1L6_9GAMM|nr:hydroxyethylthiazole kinase [Acinetobacter marinus]SDB88081.1 hydroxyethylthiazole kinase [Acinetobacter marinus]
MTTTTASHLTQAIQSLWLKLQSTQPLVHCITNSVANNFAANVCLAIGASPAMIDNKQEAGNFARVAHALSINTGTPTPEQSQAMQYAAQSADNVKKPWVLDPVGYSEILAWRSQIVDDLLQYHPTIIRANASEMATLAGAQGESKGVDSTLSAEQAVDQAQQLLGICDCVAISGASDYILSKEYGVIRITGGSALQPKVTAMGCALGAVCAAYLGVLTQDQAPALAALAAHAHFAVAAQIAEQKMQDNNAGIGSFQMLFLDTLFQITAEDFLQVDINILSK